MKKRLILFLLGLIVLFGVSVDVNAATEITVDSSKCLESDPGSCLITNEGFMTGRTYGGVKEAYKTIESFYNSSTNVITYKFTDTFRDFLLSTKGNEYDYSSLTIDEYSQIVGATDEEIQVETNQFKDDLSRLYSLFYVYVKKNEISPTECSSSDSYKYSVGTYLVVYGNSSPAVGNLQFEVDENGEWVLNSVSLEKKEGNNYELTNFWIEVNGVSKGNYVPEISANINDQIRYNFSFDVPKYPTFSINKTFSTEITVPYGIYVNDTSAISLEGIGQKFSNDENGQIIDADTGSVVATVTYLDNKISVVYNTDNILVGSIILKVDFILKENAVVGLPGNIINFVQNYVEDPYTSDITVFSSEDMLKIYTYGLKLNLTDKDDITKFLPGAVFELYDATDTEFKNILTTITIGEDGKANIAGIAAGNYVLKQIKAPTGYHLNDNYAFSFTSTDIDEDGYFTVNLTSQKYSLLPFTGGAGTLTYTLWGLLIIGVSALGIILYKKKHPVNL